MTIKTSIAKTLFACALLAGFQVHALPTQQQESFSIGFNHIRHGLNLTARGAAYISITAMMYPSQTAKLIAHKAIKTASTKPGIFALGFTSFPYLYTYAMVPSTSSRTWKEIFSEGTNKLITVPRKISKKVITSVRNNWNAKWF